MKTIKERYRELWLDNKTFINTTHNVEDDNFYDKVIYNKINEEFFNNELNIEFIPNKIYMIYKP